MVRTHRERVSALGLADPVCFLLCLPDVVFNFVYRSEFFLKTLKKQIHFLFKKKLVCFRRFPGVLTWKSN